MKRISIEKDSYYDSVFLMLINRDVKKIEGVKDAVVSMGTEMNIGLLKEIGLSSPGVENASANDLIIAVEAESEETAARACDAANDLLKKKKSAVEDGGEYRPASLETALNMVPDANLAIISLPGQYAAREVRKALARDLHVMLFSDNVSLEDEIELKKLAVEKGLLMMGPDCGTAIINGKPLCFANVVRDGDIGIVAASGTGLQEVFCCIDNLGSGVTQAIGTGGRDLKNTRVGGMMMLLGIEALKKDPRTKVIVVISKPPAPEVADKVIAALKETGKPAVIHFIGLEAKEQKDHLYFAGNLEEAAGMAVSLSKGEAYKSRVFTVPEEKVREIVAKESAGISSEQTYLRGLYTSSGGTGVNFHDNTVTNVAGESGSIAIMSWQGTGVIANNTVSYANDAIAANHSAGIQFLNNTVTNSGSGVHTDNAGDGGGTADLIQGNSVSDCTTDGYGVWVFVSYIAPTGDNNTITNCSIGLSDRKSRG